MLRRRMTADHPRPAIELRGVVKRFGEITAVNELDLDVPPGICLGLLGPNGAGKSTTMRLLTGQAIADAGELRVLDLELPREAKQARARDGRRAPARQPRRRRHRRGQPRGLRAPVPRARTSRARRRPRARARATDRPPRATRSTSSRAACAAGCCSHAASCTSPQLLLLDEPTVGLDPQIRTEIWSLIDGLRTRARRS